MKLRCKIKEKYLKEILDGKKEIEFRQIEGIIFECNGREYEFKVMKVFEYKDINSLKNKYPDVEWDDNLPCVAIVLGDMVSKNEENR